ncbi:PH domain-containing protein [Chloroflexus sp.]|uniref:PH domain-containing protein n=1 Tax=Chloroflexus sp. TaxID=1904827 RepID=UPI00298ED926|nr:PH domain-containing protein [Chloroflexus sp.]MDW8403812.1 PH domain-containing protein [Chloroflexus sp.]
MAIIHQLPPTPFRRHPLRRLPHYLCLAALNGALSVLVLRTFNAGNYWLAIGFALIGAVCLLSLTTLLIQEYRFAIVITPDRIIIDNGYPLGSRRIVERIYIHTYHFPSNPIGYLFDAGTLVIVCGDETLVFDGLTPFHTLRATLEGS